MEPMKPQDKNQILTENPAANPAEVEEYERLLSERFAADPDVPAATPTAELLAASLRDREARLLVLYQKLFVNRSNRSN